MDDVDLYRNFGVALTAGLLIGVERGWRLRGEAAGKRVAGVRTFALVGGIGGASAIIGQRLSPLIPVVIVCGVVAMLVIAHVRAIEGPAEVSATGLIAVLLALAFGLIAGSGLPTLAMAGAAVTTLILSLRTELHGLLSKLGETDIKALARFAIIAGAILPFLPNERYGPYAAWNPFELWLVVVLITGFSFAGYAANRVFGEKRGTLATAVIGGMYSSTAVTASLSHELRKSPGSEATLSAGIVLASAVMFIRVLFLTGVIAGFALPELAKAVLPGALVSTLAGVVLARKAESVGRPMKTGNPVDLLPALGFLALVAFMGLAVRWAQDRFGEAGLVVPTLLVGAADIDAAIVTLGGFPRGTIASDLAGLILAVALLANMAVKIGIIVSFAGWQNGRAAISPLAASTFLVAVIAAVEALRLGIFI